MKKFDDISDAFDYCREINKPITVLINGEKCKLFPSGRLEKTGVKNAV